MLIETVRKIYFSSTRGKNFPQGLTIFITVNEEKLFRIQNWGDGSNASMSSRNFYKLSSSFD